MERIVQVKANAYFDSVTLMAVSSRLAGLPGIRQVQVAMATEHNRELLREVGLLVEAAATAGPNDLVIGVEADDRAACERALAEAEALLNRTGAPAGGGAGPVGLKQRVRSIEAALQQEPQTSLAFISVPGQYAAREARRALERGLNVMLYSDNVSLEDEIALKQMAATNNLMLMGPDCGTAIIGGAGLGFANEVRRGPVGIVGASGTGTQEVSVLLDRLGTGISHAIGTGGRDLKAEVGSITMIQGIQALAADPQTRVLCLVSKPPAEAVARKVLAAVRESGKPAVVCFIGSDPAIVEGSGAYHAATLTDAAIKAAELAGVAAPSLSGPALPAVSLGLAQRLIRGLYCGGTLCHEAELLIGANDGHTFIDFGDDQYTVGRPHPMIDPSLRNEAIKQYAADPQTAVILLDVMLGHGSHADPAGAMIPAIREAKRGRSLLIIASVCGTDQDPQRASAQVTALEAAGVIIAPSNALAARLALAAVSDRPR